MQIFLYKAPYILHPKFLLIDDQVAVVASSNMDIRSFYLDLEVNVMVWDHGFVSRLTVIEEQYRENSHRLDLEHWLQRPWYKKYLDNVCRLTSDVQ